MLSVIKLSICTFPIIPRYCSRSLVRRCKNWILTTEGSSYFSTGSPFAQFWLDLDKTLGKLEDSLVKQQRDSETQYSRLFLFSAFRKNKNRQKNTKRNHLISHSGQTADKGISLSRRCCHVRWNMEAQKCKQMRSLFHTRVVCVLSPIHYEISRVWFPARMDFSSLVSLEANAYDM